MALRHIVSVAALPMMVTVVVPVWLAGQRHITLAPPDTPAGWAGAAAGVAALGLGLTLFAASLWRFIAVGKGTLAPWDPPRRLVVSGPYRYVRNPMISGVVFILIGEALVLRSAPHAWWAALFVAVNLVVIVGFEEGQLAQRFGEPYREYCRHVPRLLPRRTPWRPDEPDAAASLQ